MDDFRPYATKFAEVLGSLAERTGEEASPLLVPREKVKNINIILCTSDRGLCGGFNTNLINEAGKVLADKTAQDINVTYTVFGKKGRDWCRKSKLPILDQHIGIIGTQFGFQVASKAGQSVIKQFEDKEVDEVYILYAKFVSMGHQVPAVMQLLPIPSIEKSETDQKEEYIAEHICEPSASELLSEMLPKNICVQIYRALLETSTSEHAARMMAMDNATKACNDMIDNLTLAYNKARQAAVTKELMDIVVAAEALKG
jgi:F-type H+-transporting ATPase subunit gamma